MRRVRLTQGKYALVDDQDYSLVSQFKWQLAKRGKREYASRRVRLGDLVTKEYMHRLLARAPDGMDVDHINLNGLDNRRKNLRLATRSQNMFNTQKHIDNKSGHKGVYFVERVKKYVVYLTIKGKRHHLGYFPTFKEAVKSQQQGARRLQGNFAPLPTPPTL
jgi:HNH endonuclease